MNLLRGGRRALWGATTLLAACTAGPDFKAPAAPTTAQYTSEATPDLSAQDPSIVEQRVILGGKVPAQWWAPFQSPNLDGVIQRALAGNRSLAAAKATLAAAQESVTASTGALYPQVDLGASLGRQKYGAAFIGSGPATPAFTYYSVGPSVSYLLDIAGKTKRTIEQQSAIAEHQSYEVAAAYLSLTGNVVMQALAVASTRAQILTVEDILADDEKNLDLVHSAEQAGSVAQVDVLIAESQLANDRTLLPPLRQQLAIAHHAIVVLVGEAPAGWAAPDFDLSEFTLPTELPVSLPSALIRNRPDIMAAEANLHAASAAIGVATANLYPSIDLTASFAQEALTVPSLFNAASAAWSLAAGLTAPIFHGGELEAQRRQAVDNFHASLANYEQTVLESFGQVADILDALAHDAEELSAEKHAVEVAAASLRLTRLSYSAGNTGVLQVLDAQRQYQQAQLGYVRAEIQRYGDTAQLFLACGGAAISVPRQ
jgi:NodT family efflux transporter outer membrane factor (OMF) lipoprotein